MQASIRLKWYQYKRHYFDFLKVLFGIVGFEALILYIQKNLSMLYNLAYMVS